MPRAANPLAVPNVAAAWIMAAYWFTASTSFANPAVAIARLMSDTFASIRPGDVPGDVPAFIVAEAIGAAIAVLVFRSMSEPQHSSR